MNNLFGQGHSLVNKPLCPTLIHDDNTRLIVIVISLVITLFAIYKIMRYYGQ